MVLVSCSTGAEDGIGNKLSSLDAVVAAPDQDILTAMIHASEQSGGLRFSVSYEPVEEGSEVNGIIYHKEFKKS